MAQGYDPALATDPVYVDDRAQREYVRLDSTLYDRIWSGEWRF
jgi:hypothetical protein